MRIINNPNPTEEKVVICKKCGCEFAYLQSDTREDSWNNGILGPGNSGWYKKWVVCPNCGEHHTIENHYH
ncbi:MAG: hypothetical protein J6I84_04610 [Bacilli bacterium]|nr:hypothetical protein [Bacilli bacterium]